MNAFRETVDSKASRLVRDGRVTWAQGAAVIRGDHDTHRVRRNGTTWTCTCPWGVQRPDSKSCSHVLAAALTAPTAAAEVSRPAPSQPRRSARAVRYANPVRVDDARQIQALRFAGNPSVRYIEEAGVQFAVCEQVVLDCALTMAGGCAR